MRPSPGCPASEDACYTRTSVKMRPADLNHAHFLDQNRCNMKQNQTSLFILFMIASLLLIGCVPVMESAPRPLDTEAAAPDSAQADVARATVNTRSLRVRNTPSVDSPVVWGINNGESYKMIARSSDGL